MATAKSTSAKVIEKAPVFCPQHAGNLTPVWERVPLRHTSTIATSSAQNDVGILEFSFRGERYMPFEGAGAVSKWKLTLPKNFPTFDYQTISDVIIRLSYTAEQDGIWREKVEKLAGGVVESLRGILSTTGIPRLFSLRHDFPDVWSRLVNSPVNTKIDFELDDRHLPFLFYALKQSRIGMEQSDVIVYLQTDSKPTIQLQLDGQSLGTWEKETDGLYKVTTIPLTVKASHTLIVTTSGNLEPGGVATSAIDTSKLADIFLRIVIKVKK